MIRFYHKALVCVTAVLLAGCDRGTPAPASRAANPELPRLRLNHIVERYWDESASLSPWHSWGPIGTRYGAAPIDAISPQTLADSLAIEQRYLADLQDVPRAALDAQSQVTYDSFRRERKLAIQGYTFPAELMPVNPYDSMPQRFASMASAAEGQALTSDREFDDWQIRARSYARWTDQAIANMREGMRRGYTLPHVLIERMLPMLAALGDDSPANVFYAGLPTGSTAAERARLSLALTTVVKESVLPAYRALHDFLQQEYLPRSRADLGTANLPLGDSWYRYLVERATGGTLQPTELHALGIAEVERLRGRIQTLLAATAYAGNAQGFIDGMRHDAHYSYSSADALLAAYRDMLLRVTTALPALFPTLPKTALEFRLTEGFRQATSPPLSYRPALPYGKDPAVLYAVAAGLDAQPAIDVPARFLREGLPGRHYLLALQQERADLPRFRRFGGPPAFIEGWALYAVTLGDELGMYGDPQAKFGALLAQLDCAAGMVVDTGLHAQKWTRQQALDYLHAQVPIDAEAAANVVDRDLALPGDALSCTVGLLKLQSVRARIQETLGERFDLRAFHGALLRIGPVPLDLVEGALKPWVQSSLAPPASVD